MSTPVQQYLNGISQGEKTPYYYRTAKNHLLTKTTTQGPVVAQPIGNQPVSNAQAPMDPQPMGNQPISNPQPILQSIPPLVSQPVRSNLIYTINSQPTHTSQIPVTILQCYTTPSPQDHSIHNNPDGTTL